MSSLPQALPNRKSFVAALGAVGLLVGLLLLSAAGCGDDLTPIACTGQQKCPPPSTALKWAAQLFPPTAANPADQLVIQEQPLITFDATGAVTLRFTQPALVAGVIRDAEQNPVQFAHVVAVLPSAIPGQSPFSFETSSAADGSFSLSLPIPADPAGQPYFLWVGFNDGDPGATTHPPHWFNQVVSANTNLAIQLPGPAQLLTVYGHVTNPAGTGVTGMKVQVIDVNNGGAIVSTTGVTAGSADPGAYSVLVDPKLTSSTQLQVVAQPGPQTVGLAVLENIITLPAPPQVELDFALPAFRAPTNVSLLISGTGTSGATLPVAGAQVLAQVFLTDPVLDMMQQQAIYMASGQTDEQGLLTLPLVPAHYGGEMLSYSMGITSPADAPFASSVLSWQVGPDQTGVASLVLPLRAQISARILAADGVTPVPGAQVQATNLATGTALLGPSQLGGASLQAVQPQAQTDQNGRFALWLDQGNYNLDIIPVNGTQPRFSVNNQPVGSDNIELGYVTLPLPTLGKLLVLDPSGYPAGGTSLRIFELAPPSTDDACTSLAPCSSFAHLRAEFTTDNQGQGEFLLPGVPK